MTTLDDAIRYVEWAAANVDGSLAEDCRRYVRFLRDTKAFYEIGCGGPQACPYEAECRATRTRDGCRLIIELRRDEMGAGQ